MSRDITIIIILIMTADVTVEQTFYHKPLHPHGDQHFGSVDRGKVCHKKPFCSDTPKICKVKHLPITRCSGDVFNTPDDRGQARSYRLKLNATSALMTCHNNYHRVRGDRVRHCMADGNWSGTSLYCEEDPLVNRYDRALLVTIGIFTPLLLVFGVSFYQRTQQEEELRDRKLEKALIHKTRHLISGRPYSRVLPFVGLQQADLSAALRLRKEESFDLDISERMRQVSEKEDSKWTTVSENLKEINNLLKNVANRNSKGNDVLATTSVTTGNYLAKKPFSEDSLAKALPDASSRRASGYNDLKSRKSLSKDDYKRKSSTFHENKNRFSLSKEVFSTKSLFDF